MGGKDEGDSTLRRRGLTVAAVVWIVSFVVYVATLSPSVTAQDSGELATAAYVLGIPHAPGFPLWCLSAKVFTWLPVGNPAYRTNLASAFFGAGTAALVAIIVLLVSNSRLGAGVAGLALAFSQRFWSQAVITEVYTLNTFLLSGTMFCLVLWAMSNDRRWLYAGAAVFGLSLTNHYPLAVLAAPGLLGYVLLTDRKVIKEWRVLLRAVAFAVAPLLLYLYLPIRAAADPPVNWGDPSSWHRFWWHVLRKSYRMLELSKSVPLSTKFLFIGHMLGELWWQFTPVLLVPAALGFAVMWREKKNLLAMLTGTFLFNTLVLILILHFTFEYENRMRMVVCYLPAYTAVAVAIGLGTARAASFLLSILKKRRKPAMVAVASLSLLPLLPLVVHWRENNRRRDLIARDYACAILKQVPRKAVVYPSSDYTSFPLLYLQAVAGMRPDIILGDVYGTLSEELTEEYSRLGPLPAPRKRIERTIIRRSGRPVYYSEKNQFPPVQGRVLVPDGLLYRVEKAGEKRPVGWREITIRGMKDERLYKDPMTRGVVSAYHRMKAENLFAQGRREAALEAVGKASDAARDSKEMFNNLGSICAEQGEFSRAEKLYRKAVGLYPGYALARLNLAKLCAVRGRPREAAEELAEAVRLNPRLPGAKRWLEELIVLAMRSGGVSRVRREAKPKAPQVGGDEREKLEGARRELEMAVALDPRNPMPHRKLADIYAKLGDREKAAYHLSLYTALLAAQEVAPRPPAPGLPTPGKPPLPRPPRPGPPLPAPPDPHGKR